MWRGRGCWARPTSHTRAHTRHTHGHLVTQAHTLMHTCVHMRKHALTWGYADAWARVPDGLSHTCTYIYKHTPQIHACVCTHTMHTNTCTYMQKHTVCTHTQRPDTRTHVCSGLRGWHGGSALHAERHAVRGPPAWPQNAWSLLIFSFGPQFLPQQSTSLGHEGSCQPQLCSCLKSRHELDASLPGGLDSRGGCGLVRAGHEGGVQTALRCNVLFAGQMRCARPKEEPGQRGWGRGHRPCPPPPVSGAASALALWLLQGQVPGPHVPRGPKAWYSLRHLSFTGAWSPLLDFIF